MLERQSLGGLRRLMPGSSQCDGRDWVPANHGLLACCRWHCAHVNYQRYGWCALDIMYYKSTLFGATLPGPPKNLMVVSM